jgi:hypothetical protein
MPAAPGLSDPALQPKFVEYAPNALDPGFLFKDLNQNGGAVQKPNFCIRIRETLQETGLIDPKNGRRLKTPIWGYGSDTILHWAYSLHGASSANGVDYRQYSIKKNGVPIITHLHGAKGLGTPQQTDTLVFEPGSRYDIVANFGLEGKWIIMNNIYGGAATIMEPRKSQTQMSSDRSHLGMLTRQPRIDVDNERNRKEKVHD